MSGLSWCAAALAALAAAAAVPAPGDRLLATRVPGARGRRRRVRAGAGSLLRRRGRRAPIDRARAREACDALAAELRVGHPPAVALEAAADLLPCLRPVAMAAKLGGDVPAAFRAIDGGLAELFRPLAVAWSVGEQTGAGLARLLASAVTGLLHDEELRREVSMQLAGPRATARLLAGLPVLGLVLGGGLSTDPIRFLFGTGAGLLCLAAGVALAGSGLWWVEQLARRAEGLR